MVIILTHLPPAIIRHDAMNRGKVLLRLCSQGKQAMFDIVQQNRKEDRKVLEPCTGSNFGIKELGREGYLAGKNVSRWRERKNEKKPTYQ